jgi:hypothetical protein
LLAPLGKRRFAASKLVWLWKMARVTGLEPATFGVTGPEKVNKIKTRSIKCVEYCT